MIPGGAVNNTPRSCVPGFRSLVCSPKMHCIVSVIMAIHQKHLNGAAYTGDCRTIRATLIDKLSSSRRRLFTSFLLSIGFTALHSSFKHNTDLRERSFTV
ncbi:hypothetical protein N7463_002000 [Penicillium fimorum]|uniref:Uncharacterized protein n=1 Tax=Penicillium fimorum TaxID=1882269 RepID=A0A9X0C7X4_9EURO|nr:hypothetical protein N7463_002000 [Penicillium fimorum]